MIEFVMFVAAMINGLIKGKSITGNNISLILGEEVLNIKKKINNFLVETNKSAYCTKKIIDTRRRKN